MWRHKRKDARFRLYPSKFGLNLDMAMTKVKLEQRQVDKKISPSMRLKGMLTCAAPYKGEKHFAHALPVSGAIDLWIKDVFCLWRSSWTGHVFHIKCLSYHSCFRQAGWVLMLIFWWRPLELKPVTCKFCTVGFSFRTSNRDWILKCQFREKRKRTWSKGIEAAENEHWIGQSRSCSWHIQTKASCWNDAESLHLVTKTEVWEIVEDSMWLQFYGMKIWRMSEDNVSSV